jgi:hypothetical protein
MVESRRQFRVVRPVLALVGVGLVVAAFLVRLPSRYGLVELKTRPVVIRPQSRGAPAYVSQQTLLRASYPRLLRESASV